MAKRNRKSDTTSSSRSSKKTSGPKTRSRVSKPVATKTSSKSSSSVSVEATNKTNKRVNNNVGKKPKSESKPKKVKEIKPKVTKSVNKKSSNKNTNVQKPPKISKPPTKRGRKPKIKNSNEEKRKKTKKQIEEDDDDLTEEETLEEVPVRNVIDVNQKKTKTKDSIAENDPPIRFEGGFNMPQQEPLQQPVRKENLAKSYDFDSSKSNYLSSLYNNNVISSSSTSAFTSVPIMPKFNTAANHLLPHPMIANETSMSSILTGSASIPSSNVAVASQPLTPPILNSNHQSLLSPPQHHQNNQSNDPVHDLPPELLQQGWRKCWSRREERHYYFNKNTNESIWEMPKLSNIYDPLTDPLGIQSPNPTSFQQPLTSSDQITPPIYPQLTPPFPSFLNKNSDSMSSEKIFAGPFDFEIESNCYIWEGLFFYYFHPHPDIEIARCNFVQKLRQQYRELCRSRQNLDPPKDSFTKWILERKVHDKGCDPFLPMDCMHELSSSLYNEIMNDIPIRLVKPKFSGEARKQLSNYAEAAKKIIDSPHVLAAHRKIVKWNVEDAFEWIRKTLNATFEEFIERLEHLKKQCQPLIIEASKAAVEAICAKIYHVAKEYALKIRELNLELFKKEDLREREPFRFQNQKRICFPAYLINPCPKLPIVQLFIEKDTRLLRYKNELLRVSACHFQKLEFLYWYNCRDDRKYNLFLVRVWCLLKRYQSFYDKTEGFSSQNSLPLSVFYSLSKHFGVTFECFSSPLNCYFRQYCSFFPDTDGYFGSRGSILNFFPMSGSFEAFPPESEDLIEASIVHFEKLLENTMEPLSFIVFIQEKPEILQKIISKLESNKFKRTHLSIPALEHEFRHGFQHICSKNEIHVKSPYNTLIYFLQNDAGFLKWGPTPERIEELVESFKLGRDKELVIIPPSIIQANTNTVTNMKPEAEIRNGNEP